MLYVFFLNSFGGDIKTNKCKTYFDQHCYRFVGAFSKFHLKASSDIFPLRIPYEDLKAQDL